MTGDPTLSRDLCDCTFSRLNGVRDLNCRSFFILLSSLPLIIGTFVTESTAYIVLYRTRHSFQEYSNKGAFRNHIASNKMCLFDFFTVKRLHTIIYVKYFVILKTLHEVSSVCTVSQRRFIVSQRRFFVSQKVGTILKSELVQTTPVNTTAPHHFRGKKLKPQWS